MLGSVPRGRAVAFLLLSWICNFVGAAFVFYLIAYQGEWTNSGPVHAYVIKNAEHKCGLPWFVALLRCGTPQHGLYSKNMTLITSDYGIMRSLSIKWP